MYGWMGTILRVDLTKGKITKQPLDESVARDYIGGRGFNSMTLFKEVKPDIDPLGPDNVLCIAPGPLTGTSLNQTSRMEVSTLSPLSGILGDGSGGAHFPAYLKRAGYDQIVITGKASSPKYLWIDDGNVELRDASHLWGKTTWETVDTLQETHGKDVRVSCIGQSGENLVRFASIILDKYSSAARGSGAVLGSKNLKAIAVRGTSKVELANPEEFKELVREDREFLRTDKRHREVVSVYGSHIGMRDWFPFRRHYAEYLPPDKVPEQLLPDAWRKYETKRAPCHGCITPCKEEFMIPTGRRAGEKGQALEFENIVNLGPNCGIEDPIVIMEMGNLADAYGMEVMALGNTIAFVKELYNLGIITKEDTGGLSLEWEDAESQIELMHQIALREGFGNLVAEGEYGLAKIIGRGAIDYCYHVKGVTRGVYGLWDDHARVYCLAHSTGTRGADHLRGRTWACEDEAHYYPILLEKGLLPSNIPQRLTVAERAATLADTIGRCKGAVNNWTLAVPLVAKYPLWGGVAKLLTAEVGVEFDAAKLEEAADRIYILEMAFNARQGIRRKHDRLPQKPEWKGTPEGERDLKEHAEMLTEYYRLHGCDLEEGIPTRERLEQLGLKYVADELEAHGSYPEWDGPPLRPLGMYPHGGVRA